MIPKPYVPRLFLTYTTGSLSRPSARYRSERRAMNSSTSSASFTRHVSFSRHFFSETKESQIKYHGSMPIIPLTSSTNGRRWSKCIDFFLLCHPICGFGKMCGDESPCKPSSVKSLLRRIKSGCSPLTKRTSSITSTRFNGSGPWIPLSNSNPSSSGLPIVQRYPADSTSLHNVLRFST